MLSESAPKLVAINIGWIERENIMSVIARAMINTSVAHSFLKGVTIVGLPLMDCLLLLFSLDPRFVFI